MADNIKAVALAANLQGQSKKQVDDLVKSLFVHRELSNLPKDVAVAKYAQLPPDQQADLVKKYGTEDPTTKPSRGWFGTAWHYAASYNPITLAFKGAIEASDAMTRAYRAIAIPLSEGEIGFAWDKANDKGDKVYNEGRIEDAKAKYGRDAVDIAMRIKSGEDVGKLFATATPEQQKYIMLADPLNKSIPNVANIDAARDLFNDTLAEVDRAKFSPGRQLANAILPEALEKNGLVYGLTSGVIDAAYRLFADPLVVGAKLRSLYVISKYSLDVVTKGAKVAEYFANPTATAFWDQYGSALAKYTRLQKSNSKGKELVDARNDLKRLAPEFGQEVIRVFQKADIVDANTAKGFLLNTEESVNLLKGSVGRKRVILPRLDAQRKARIAIITGTSKVAKDIGKVINIDKFAPRIMDDLYGQLSDTDGILKTLSEDSTILGAKIKQSQDLKNFVRLPSRAIGERLDKFKAKFNIAPMFKDDMFDVTAKDASTQVYRLARLIMTKYDAKMVAETFEAADDVGKRKEMVKGIWGTIAEARGLNLTEAGQKIVKQTVTKGDAKFSVANFADDFQELGVLPSDYNPFMTTPSLVDIDRAAARSGLINRMFGYANKGWVDNMTGYWSFLTLAGPRYAIRNASEDLMVHLAIGGTPWGLAKNRFLSTRVNTALEGARKTGTWNDNPLGGLLRILNKKEAGKFEAEITAVDDLIVKARAEIKLKKESMKITTDPVAKASIATEIETLKASVVGGSVGQVRRIMATSLTSGRVNRFRERLGMRPMFEDEAAILAEHMIYGNLDNSMSIVSEGASNFATGGDYITRATIFTRTHGVRSEALVINEPKAAKYGIAKDGRKFEPRALRNQDEAALLTWLMRIDYQANDRLGAIAIANLSDTPEGKELAITKIMDWMDENPSFRKEAQLAAKGQDERQHAELVYKRAKELFEKSGTKAGSDKEINLDLLNKIRVRNDQGDYIISGQLSLDDVSKFDDADIPAYVLGPQLVPIAESGQVTSSIISKGWTWLGLSNSRMSRQPIVFNEIINIRKQMKKSGFEEAYIASVVSKVTPPVSKTSKIPEGIKFETLGENSVANKILLRENYGLNKQQANQAMNANTIIAVDSKGNYVGHISWNKDTGKIQLVNVSQEMQRKGIATKLFDEANNLKNGAIKPIQEDIAANLSPEGLAWKKSIESDKSKLTENTYAKKVATATDRAKRQFATIVEERAVSQTLQYVDNPLVRTQLAFGARNFSRFYRATEDFYRRMSRVVAYNPMALRKAALTYDGISHNGWIQEDDQGEKYFVYPGIEPIYAAVRTAMTTLGIPADFKTPFPVQFGAQVKMLTPSLNQDSLIPTFSGPLAGVSMKVISNLVDVAGAPGAADTITQVSMGKYAVGRSFVSSFLPAHVNRIYETMSTDERDSQYASAWRKAVTYLEAGGHGLPENYDETGNLIPPSIQEQEQYRQRIKNTVLGILGTRFVYGFFAPASPQVQLKADMATWIKDNGKTNFKQAWNSLLDQYPGDYDAAMTKWVELFPNEIPFTVSESEKKTVAVIKYAEESGTFVENNKDLFEKYPQGAAFLIPHKSGFSWDAYKTMKDMGLKYNKRVDDYLREVQTAADLQVYYGKKNDYEVSLTTKVTDFERTMARNEFQDWAKIFKAGRPLLQEELSEGGKKAIERINAIDDLRKMLNDKSVTTRSPVQKTLKEMLDVYDSYKMQRQAMDTLSGTRNLVAFMKDSAIVKIRELSKANENTMSAYNTLFASLLGDTNG
jgi:hypothetical protein